MNLNDLKAANKSFFEAAGFYSDCDYEIILVNKKPALRVTSKFGTRPVYKIDLTTCELSFLHHDVDVPVQIVSEEKEVETSNQTNKEKHFNLYELCDCRGVITGCQKCNGKGHYTSRELCRRERLGIGKVCACQGVNLHCYKCYGSGYVKDYAHQKD